MSFKHFSIKNLRFCVNLNFAVLKFDLESRLPVSIWFLTSDDQKMLRNRITTRMLYNKNFPDLYDRLIVFGKYITISLLKNHLLRSYKFSSLFQDFFFFGKDSETSDG